ncbi:MAG: DUF302 domain-containing protein [Patescibacteria group bacterium]|nr:DUF302 domain-containing protein [Patescibacteria group bacterium]
MNLSYFRKSKSGVKEASEKVKKLAAKMGWQVMGESDLSVGEAKLIFALRPEWAVEAIKASSSAVALLPVSILIKEENGQTVLGMGNPAIMGDAFGSQELAEKALAMEQEVRKLIDGAAGAGALTPTKTVVYSTTTCPYCQMEKAYLDEKGVKYENIMVDINQEAAREMVKRTGQMGVPVTQVEYDDAEPEYVVGFDKERLNKLLNIK